MVNWSVTAKASNLRDPIVVVAYEGWNDAADSASGVLDHLMQNYETDYWFSFDAEEYYDFQLTRPRVKQGPEGADLIWPSTELNICHLPNRDLVIIGGPEPNLKWRSYRTAILSAIKSIDPEMVVLLGALLSDAPHSRPLPVDGSSNDRAISLAFNFERSSYEGPTGIIGVLSDGLRTLEIPTVSLWVSVPHYASNPPNPKATMALLRQLQELLDTDLELGDLPELTKAWERGVSDAAGEDPDVSEYIRELEDRSDRTDLPDSIGDDLANELERFLRKRNQE